MDNSVVTAVSSITVGQALAWLVALAAGITGIGKAVDWITSKRKRYPCEERLKMLDNDKKRLDRIEIMMVEQDKTNAVILRSLYALINHEITGNNVDKLKDVQSELYDYLIKR